MSAKKESRWLALGQAVTTSRDRRGWLQSDLAKQLGVRQQTVSRWEKGISRPEPAMVRRLAALLPDRTSEEWISLAGHAIQRHNRSHHAVVVASPPLFAALPLSSLSHERFEDFCRDVLAARYAEASVNRVGGQGDRQDGIDIEAVFRNGARFGYQCKRHKTFGPKKVTFAVKALKAKVKRAYILLSRPATAAARRAIKRYRTWELWDSEYISRVVRQELLRDQACRVVDTYFPGLRQSFLGIVEPSPFLSVDEYFAPFLKHTIFSHAWNLVGRIEKVQQLSTTLGKDSRGVAVLTGSGGIGKSRVLLALCEQFRSTHPSVAVRLVGTSANVTPRDFDLLRGQETLLLVDDAHDRSDLNLICGLVSRSSDSIRLLLATRPYALPVVKAELSRAALLMPDDAIIALPHLRRNEVEQLAREILTTLGGPIAAATDIARVTADSPLATVVGSYLVATKRISPLVLANEATFRDELYRSFEDAITGELGKIERPDVIRDALGLLALIQPIDPDDPDFRAVGTQILSHPIDTILRTLTRLHEAGVLVKRGRRLRVVPDLLGEYILEDRCLSGPSRSSSGFAERVASCAGSDLLRNLIVNFSRLDWRLSQATDAADHIAEPLWESLTQSYARDTVKRPAIAHAISEAAYYLPARALHFADLVIKEASEEVKQIPTLLRRIAYNYDFIDEACRRLWALGRDDNRPLNREPEHPIRILCELAAVERDKPVEYCDAVVDFAIREMRNPDNHNHANSLFDVLESGLKTEGHTTQSRGLAITFSRFLVRFEAVKLIRQKIIAFLLELVCQGKPRIAVRAAHALNDALRYPMGSTEDSGRDVWTPEFISTLEKVAKVFATEDIDPVVTVELQRAISWHAIYAKGPTLAVASKANEAIVKTLAYQLTLNLLDGWGHIRERTDDHNAAREALQEDMRATARDLIAAHPTPEQVQAVLEQRFTAIHELRGDDDRSSNLFMAIVSEECPGLCQTIWSAAIAKGPAYPLISTLDCLLGTLIDRDPERALIVARDALVTGRQELSRAVAFAYGWHCGRTRPVTENEMDLIADLCIHEDPITVTGVIRAVERVAAKNKNRALDMFVSIDFGKNNQRLSHEAFVVFLHDNNLRVESLDAITLGKLLTKLVPVSAIEDYWVTQFIGKASSKFPDKVREFLLERIDVERLRKEERLYGYDAIPWHWNEDAKLGFRDQPDFSRHVAAIVMWLRSRKDWVARDSTAVLFSSACGTYDDVTLTALGPHLFSSDPEEAEAASALLRKAPRTFVFAQASFVARLLAHANSLGKETLEAVGGDLWSAAISGVKHGTPGQPFPEDTEMAATAAAQLAALPKGSPAWDFYAGLKRHAEAEIQRAKRDRPEFDDIDEE